MKRLNFFAILLVALLCWVGSANSSTVNVTWDDTAKWNIYSVAGWATTGNLMDGLSVTAIFSDGSSDSALWAGGSGAIGTDNWSVTMPDYTTNTWFDDTEWVLTNNNALSLTTLIFDGRDADVVFDRILFPENTPGSELGRAITGTDDTDSRTVNALYSHNVTLQGVEYSDLYSTLTLSFVGGVATGESFVFAADTDNVNVAVPEPATMLLMGLGMAGLVGSRGYRRRSKNLKNKE